MNFKIIISFSLLLLLTSIPTAQSQIDSLKHIWENENELDSMRFKALEAYYDLSNKVQPDSALKSLDYYYKLANEKNETKHLFLAAKKIGNVNRLIGNYDTAMKAYEEAEALANQLSDPDLQAAILGNMGNIFIHKKDYKRATQNFSSALKIYQQENNLEAECRMLTNLGSVFLIIDNYTLASEYYQKSLSNLKKRGIEDRNNGILYINIGWTNLELGHYEEARDYFHKGLKIFEDENDKIFIASCYSSLAKVNLKLNNFSKAKFYGTKNLSLNKELGIKPGVGDAKIMMAQLAYETSIDEATKLGESILIEMPPLTDKETKRDLYELLYQCYKSQNRLDLSLKMHEQYTIYNDSIQVEKNSFSVAREAVKNDFEIKLNESKLENEKEKAALKISQLKRIFFIVLAAIFLIGILLFYFLTRINKDSQKQELLLAEIEEIKNKTSPAYMGDSNKFTLHRDKIESYLKRNLNETDWKVLNILLDDPVIPNKEIAKKAFMSTDGIGSSLRRMYEYFEVKESRYKKISLLMLAIKLSNN